MQPSQPSPQDPNAPQWEATPPPALSQGYPSQPTQQFQPGQQAWSGAPQGGQAWTGAAATPPAAPRAPLQEGWVPEQPTRVRREVRTIAIAMMIAALVGAVGSFAPWLHFSDGETSTNIDGLDYGGLMTIAPCITVGVMGALLWYRTVLGLMVTSLACGAAVLFIVLMSFYPANWIAEATSFGNTGSLDFGGSEIGAGASWGLWVTLVSGIAMTGCGLAAVLRGVWLVPAAPAKESGTD